jgi:hypothetical protein
MVVELTLARGSAAERAVAASLTGLLSRYDLSPWEFTSSVLIDAAAPFPHSHPVLTLNARNGGTFLLGAHLHEQLHWFCTSRWAEASSVLEELRRRYPAMPVGLPEGARDEQSTYLHLLVCWQELAPLADR